MAGRRSTTVVMMDQKKQPAKRTGKEEELISNFWELTVQNKIVYRYDVAVFLGTRTNSKAVNYLRGPRDDSALVARRRACLCALQLALERYRILSEGSEFVYDGSAMMFSSEDLAPALKKHHGLLTVNMSDLPVQLSKQTKFYCPDGDSFTIEISRCRDSAESLNMADLSAHMNNNWAALNRSLNQFYELLVTRDAVIRGHFTQYGIGCLYNQLASGDVGCGYERFNGVRKGIKFIEGKRTNDVVPAVVLDHRTGLFFKSQPLIKSVRELDGLQSVEQFDFSDFNGRMNTMWNKVNEYVKGIRMTYVGLNSKPISAVAIGISKVPISEAKDFVNRDEESVLERYSDGRVPINPYWPAVKLLVRNKVACFPMEAVQVEPNQRVPIEKQQMAKCVRKTDKPEVRLATITKLLEALNLHQQGSQNKFLKAFQVSVSPSPIIVKAFRRQPPAILHGGKQASAVDDLKFKWRQNGSTPYVEGGRVDRIILVYSDRSIPTASWEALQKLLKTRGVQFGKMEQLIISYSNSLDMEKQLTDCFNKVSAERKQFRKSAFIVFIDRAENKSHDFLKLLERKYRIPTQHITAEIACALSTKPQSCLNVVSKMNLKLGGMNYEVVPEAFSQNIWISKGKTLIVGYDVAHPGKPTRDEVMNKMPPQKPSVVGFSFNGAQHREKFIGDYHFQTPRREQVDHCVLNSRFKWMLGLFTKNRKSWPESVIVTRDGVSEGQYRMVVEEELHAMKQACEEFGNLHGRDEWVPHFTVVVATKRHNARFFSKDNGITNPKPGTVIDTDVVRNDITEFYMQSHYPLQGTARPTAYQVLIDENNMSMDAVQSLMLALTFHHQISDGSVSLPEPTYQADEWAKRGKNMWNAYMFRHEPIKMDCCGDYALPPIDFDAMTDRLAFWKTELEHLRVNA